MSLQPIAIELCQGSALRGRRRSSIRPQNLLPHLLTSPPNQNESAVEDEVAPEFLSVPDRFSAPSVLISPLSDAHVSGHASSFTTSRHHDALSIHKSVITVSPSDTAVTGDSYFEPKNTPTNDPRSKWRLASALLLYFLNGWGDGVTGTALPYFRAEFHLSYMTSSLLFVCTTVGFTSGTLLVPHIMNFLGRFYLADSKMSWLPTSPFRIALRKPPPGSTGHSASQARYIVLIFSLCAPISFVMMGSRTVSFAFMAYVVVSFGRSVVTAPMNMFLSKGTSHLGTAFGVWGLGAVASPLVFQLTAAAGLPWANFYFGSLVLAAVSIVFLVITFMPTEREFAMDRQMALEAADPGSKPSPSSITNSGIISNSSSSQTHPTSPSQLRLVASMRHQWTVSLFSLFYCGTETTTQGLIVQYLLAQRSANPNTAGYVTSGFWAGMSASRLLWSYFTPRISFTSRKYIIQSCLRCTGLGLGMQLCIWLINSTVENAVSASLIGVFYGPLFPVCLELANDLLPVEVSMVSMAIISASGSIGSAILPFITGVVTTKYGMRTWSYITVAQAAILFGAWYLFPTRQPPRRITPA